MSNKQISQQKKHKFKDYTKILTVNEKYQLQNQEITKVKSLLQQQVEYLIEKKEKEKEKRKRLEMMEQEFQRKRKQKISQLQEKIHQSEKAKQTLIKQKLERNKRNLQQVQKINQRIHNQYKETISKGLQNRKKFYSQRKKQTKTQTSEALKRNPINKSVHQSSLNTSRTANDIKTHRTDVDKIMKNIEEKLSKANKNHEIYQKKIINKLYEKDRNHSEIKDKIISHSMMQQQKKLKQILGKNQNIYETGQKVKQLTQKHLTQRRRSFQQKIKKIHQNIKYLESQKQEKFASLQDKFNKICQPKINYRRTNQSGSNRDRVLMNNLKLQEQKKQKADQIIKKHAEITAKNKIYKEKKDQILQTINKVNPQNIQ